jgi:hypothetical protein
MIIRGHAELLGAVFTDEGGHPRYEVVEYTDGKRGGPTQWVLYSKGPGIVGDSYGIPTDEASRGISLDEARAWVQARLQAGEVEEIGAREALEYLDDPGHAGRAVGVKGR